MLFLFSFHFGVFKCGVGIRLGRREGGGRGEGFINRMKQQLIDDGTEKNRLIVKLLFPHKSYHGFMHVKVM